MKFLKYVFLILAAFIWLSGLSAGVLSLTGGLRRLQDGYQFGDLYRLSNLAEFKDPRKQCMLHLPVAKKTGSGKVNLYLIGDSFTEPGRIEKQNFDVDVFQYVHWDQALHVKLDTSATNILLLETVERHFREKFHAPINNVISDSATFITSAANLSAMQKLDMAFSAKGTEARLDMLLFQNNAVMKIKEWKAAINYHMFNRVSSDVTLVNDNRDLVFYMDTDPDSTKSTSSFKPLSDSAVTALVHNVMKSAKSARSKGFDQVLLSVIPNKVSIVDPEYGTYNNLITRVYDHPALNLQVVDVLPEFRKFKSASYLKGDSHWTCEGQNIWLDKVNRLIYKAD